METSDSEYFESADEDFYSDEDTTSSTEKQVSSIGEKHLKPTVAPVQEEIGNLKIEEQEIDQNLVKISKDVVDKHILNKMNPAEELVNKDESCVKIDHKDGLNSNTKVKTDNRISDECKLDNTRNTNLDKPTLTSEDIKAAETGNSKEKYSKIHDVNSNSEKSPDVAFMDRIEDKKIDDLNVPENKATKEKDINEISWNNDGWDIDEYSGNEENLWTEDEIGWIVENEPQPKLSSKDSNKTSNTKTFDKTHIEDVQKQVTTLQSSSCKENANEGWGGWGGWEVSSILSTATQSVSTLTSHVSQGLSTALETGMGIPNAEELAKLHATAEKTAETDKSENTSIADYSSQSTFGFGLGNLVSGVSNITKFVETTGTKVISGGLDTLETIGKKTMEVLQEGDPGLKKKRSFLKLEPSKPVLSQILREAKLKAEQEEISVQEKHVPKKNYERLFDDHHGLVHLEALEMLSKQCEIKLGMLMENSDANSLTDLQETLEQVKVLCELPDEDDEEQLSLEDIRAKLTSAVEDIKVNITYSRLLSTWEETESWLDSLNLNICDENEIHQQAIETLAQITAIAVEQYHKAGELLLIKESRSTADEADSLVELTTTLTSLIGIVAGKFTDKLNSRGTGLLNTKEVNSLITNVFFEAANSSSYIQDAFQLLIPVLQVGIV